MPRLGWRAELALPALLGLPDDAVAAAPAGQLGLGGAYYAANGARNSAGLFVKQLWVRVGSAPAAHGHSAKLGRFEFSDGGEWAPRDPRLASVRQSRLSQRLVGPFGFTHGQRSFDGASYAWRVGEQHVSLTAMRPTVGVFDTDGSGSLPVDVVYAAYNRNAGSGAAPADLRFFALYYNDRRGTVPVDSRPAAVRANGPRGVGIGTVGAHWIQRWGDVDLLAWGLRQVGHWGGLEHRAGALVLEAGWRDAARRWQPSLRVGAMRSSGDEDPNDQTHGTFFQILPTPRPVALFPFHNMQNVEEEYLLLELQPRPRWALRGGVHALRLREGSDLWFLGGGAFDRQSFGYAGRPANGATELSDAMHVSVEWRPSTRLHLELFAAQASGGAVTAASYGERHLARFVYLETTVRR